MDRRIIILGNGLEWCEKSLSDFKKVPNTKIINKLFPYKSKIVRKFLNVHFSDKLNKKKSLLFKSKWFPYFVKCMSTDRDTPLLIIIYDRNKLANEAKFLSYLRKYYKDVKLVYTHSEN